MAGRIIINREGIDACILSMTRAWPRELALRALRKPVLNAPELYRPVRTMLESPPWWLTETMLENGAFYEFRIDPCPERSPVLRQWRLIDRWLELSNRHRPDPDTREGRKWIKRLNHIRTFDEGVAIAEREMTRWTKTQDGVPPPPAEAPVIRRIIDVPDGRVWFELLNDSAVIDEGGMMMNCLRDRSAAQSQRQRSRIFSLRGNDISEHVTLACDKLSPLTAYRRLNRPIEERDRQPIRLLCEALAEEDRQNGVVNPSLALGFESFLRFRPDLTGNVCRVGRTARVETVKLLDRPYNEIDEVVRDWIAGPDDDLESLLGLLLQDQEGWSDEDAPSDEYSNADSEACEIVEGAICSLEPTPLNLQRIRGWCASYTLPAGYEAMLTRFSHLLSEEEYRACRAEAVSLFIPEIVSEWLDRE